MPHRIAMWSGPRNLSTAMLRAWENRPDTFVCDEPLYAHYLQQTQRSDHPGYEETLRRHSTDWRAVAEWLTGPIPGDAEIFYQKQMAHHLLPNVELDWTDQLTNCLLIREPAEMLTSLMEFLPSPTVEDTGLPQQVKLFEREQERRAGPPPVIDARDVLANPRGVLTVLCELVGVAFREEMLSWPTGPRETDGAWGPWWYEKVYQTTSFGTYRPKGVPVPSHLSKVLEECQRLYDKLSAERISAVESSP